MRCRAMFGQRLTHSIGMAKGVWLPAPYPTRKPSRTRSPQRLQLSYQMPSLDALPAVSTSCATQNVLLYSRKSDSPIRQHLVWPFGLSVREERL
jgi:hypothetical protein